MVLELIPLGSHPECQTISRPWVEIIGLSEYDAIGCRREDGLAYVLAWVEPDNDPHEVDFWLVQTFSPVPIAIMKRLKYLGSMPLASGLTHVFEGKLRP